MRGRRATCPVVLLCLATFSTALAAAPPQLRNKNITISMMLKIVQRAPDGRMGAPDLQSQQVIYVSNAGRAFLRSTRSINNPSFSGSRVQDYAPGKGPSGNADPREVHFEGNKLVSSMGFTSGAARTVVSFDPGYSSCSVSVMYGKQGGAPLKWRGLDGQQYEVESIGVASQTCTIRDGNPFVN